MSNLFQVQLKFPDIEKIILTNWKETLPPIAPMFQDLSKQMTLDVNSIAKQFQDTLVPVLADFTNDCTHQIQACINQFAKTNLSVSVSLNKVYRSISALEQEKPLTNAEKNVLKYTSQNLSLVVNLPPDKITDKSLNDFYNIIVKLESQSHATADCHQYSNRHKIHTHEQTSSKSNLTNITTNVTANLISELIKIIIVLLVTHGDKVYSFVIDILEFINHYFSSR